MGPYVPDLQEFLRLARWAEVVPVYREVLADLDTPLSAYLKVVRPPYGFLLESVEGGERWGRYSLLGTEPWGMLRGKGQRVVVEEGGRSRVLSGNPLRVLCDLLASLRVAEIPGLPRFFGGAVGYLGYDLVRHFERLPQLKPDDLGLPDLCVMLVDRALIFDNLTHTLKAVALARVSDDPRRAYGEAVRAVDELLERLRGRPSLPPVPRRAEVEVGSNMSREAFLEMVARAKEYIVGGEAIQVVLSQRLEVSADLPPLQAYRALRLINPSPYMYLLELGDHALVGSSPEVMVRLEDGRVVVRPIAGTRPRGSTEREDRALEEELRRDEKELAEHIMLVDLGRNDVGRVSRVGSVRVSELMAVERYSHVMHLVSQVEGDLAEGCGPLEVIGATFPAGTVTGAPKVRAMEIIEELEPVRRGVYAGAVGYLSPTGNLDLCITIRTILFRQGRMYVQSGAGVVADSQPEREYQETLRKAEGMIAAIRMAMNDFGQFSPSISQNLQNSPSS